MNPLDQTIAKIQHTYSGETNSSVFRDLLEQEKKGKKRKVLKRWLREMIKSLEQPHSLREWSEQASSVPTDDPEFKMFEDDDSPTTESNRTFFKPPKDKITGIPIIG